MSSQVIQAKDGSYTRHKLLKSHNLYKYTGKMLDRRFHPSLSYSQSSGSNFMSEGPEVENKSSQRSCVLNQENFLSSCGIKAYQRKKKSEPCEDQSAPGEVPLPQS